jgi:hypothetical protein
VCGRSGNFSERAAILPTSPQRPEVRKKSNTINLAGESVSRILSAPRTNSCAWRGDHSSRSRIAPGLKQPTRGLRALRRSETQTGRASPPLLFDLAPRGVFRAPSVATRAVGSYPTFSPLPNALDRRRRAKGFALGLPPRSKLTGGLSFCGTFRSRAANRAFALFDAQPPGVTRRATLRSNFLAALAGPAAMESGLSSRPGRPHGCPYGRPEPAIARLTRCRNYISLGARVLPDS